MPRLAPPRTSSSRDTAPPVPFPSLVAAEHRVARERARAAPCDAARHVAHDGRARPLIVHRDPSYPLTGVPLGGMTWYDMVYHGMTWYDVV